MEKIQFDKDKALDKAMVLFWKKGYEQTSLQELLSAMKILNGSFYHSFKNKENLFLMCLDKYSDEVLQERIQKILEAPTLKKGLNRFYSVLINDFKDKNNPKGCMIVNSIQFELLNNSKVKKCLVDKMNLLKSALKEELKKEKVSGDLDVLSEMILSFSRGISKSALLGDSEESLEKQAKQFVDLLPLN